MNRMISAALVALALACAAPAHAQLQVGANDTVESVLRAQKDKRVTLRLRSGQEMTGVVRMSNARVVQLGALSGREFFDAVVPLEAIDAVLVRTKE
jgi:hypothetical protein